MAYDENLANRIREIVLTDPGVTEKAMFGGLAFSIGGNMSVSASGQGGLLPRVDPAEATFEHRCCSNSPPSPTALPLEHPAEYRLVPAVGAEQAVTLGGHAHVCLGLRAATDHVGVAKHRHHRSVLGLGP